MPTLTSDEIQSEACQECIEERIVDALAYDVIMTDDRNGVADYAVVSWILDVLPDERKRLIKMHSPYSVEIGEVSDLQDDGMSIFDWKKKVMVEIHQKFVAQVCMKKHQGDPELRVDGKIRLPVRIR